MGIFDLFFKPQTTPLQRVANMFARSVVVRAALSTEAVFQQIRPDDKTDFMNVLAEFVCVFCHGIDRNAFRTLGAEKRDIFDVEIEKRCMNYLVEICEKYEPNNPIISSRMLLEDFFISKIEQRMPSYAKMRELWTSNQTDSLSGTVFWEFGKIITETYFNDDSANSIVVSMQCVDSFIKLDEDVGGLQQKLHSLK